MKKQKDKTLKGELPQLVGTQNATGEEWRNSSRKNAETKKKKNAETEPKQKQHPVVDVTGDGTKSDSVKSNIA